MEEKFCVPRDKLLKSGYSSRFIAFAKAVYMHSIAILTDTYVLYKKRHGGIKRVCVCVSV